ncbi:glutathione S-transferase N-terminal domain-containing protein [Aliivibrio sp. S4TY2]|uniref:glutathione S-transferase family protein n=1 Tax=unclassified Aliivibrio TaxID=2645654 RepID=UPI00237997E3|nr:MULTISPECIES: glutathione S-transferase C-terminal domain-containing protein [unclassified Aliivibrio]MDD9158228.1 glutathione S-transferase N-terminal domain-containing protein [Aliivibrio sp. S4TY2]MDD9162143.1 glutathione S-transferase N-terminal domain-containing protein [Aliivibrio sp. S4TY1]MDD9166181.1 glutathione S-transferase N-terminal domain-containing protein [Aliivibrio sp. S4MY2]MDD9170179.1 glutathione S-transferase N-terminal domain-containing protein [Aliivibrio sp. S4MY4]M
MLKFYFHQTPNPMKIALYLAETELPFELMPVDTLKGEQHTKEYRAINPNGKVPAIVDDGVRVFDSSAILLYLSETRGKLGGKAEDRAEMLSWLLFIASGLGPFSGQSVHFRHFAPEKLPYAINRYLSEAQRHYDVLDKHLEGREYIVGDEFSIADISAWGWIDKATVVLGEEGLAPYPNIQRWFDGINSRPAVEKARNIANNVEFKSEFDEEANRSLYPQNFAKSGSAKY